MLVLYHCNTSYASQIVRLYLEACHLSWQGHHLDLRKQEHILSDYRKINPLCTVPTLKDDEYDLTITNSTDILIHLTKNYVNSNFHVDKKVLPTIVNFCREQELFHDPHLRLLSYSYIFFKKDSIDKAKLDNLLSIAKQHPNKARGDFLIKLIQGEVTDSELEQAKAAAIKFINKVSQLLSANSYSTYLFGSRDTTGFTMADASAIAGLFRLIKLGMLEDIKKHSNVYDYYNEISAISYFKQANMC